MPVWARRSIGSSASAPGRWMGIDRRRLCLPSPDRKQQLAGDQLVGGLAADAGLGEAIDRELSLGSGTMDGDRQAAVVLAVSLLCQSHDVQSAVPTITSDALMIAVTWLPGRRPSSSTAST